MTSPVVEIIERILQQKLDDDCINRIIEFYSEGFKGLTLQEFDYKIRGNYVYTTRRCSNLQCSRSRQPNKTITIRKMWVINVHNFVRCEHWLMNGLELTIQQHPEVTWCYKCGGGIKSPRFEFLNELQMRALWIDHIWEDGNNESNTIQYNSHYHKVRVFLPEYCTKKQKEQLDKKCDVHFHTAL